MLLLVPAGAAFFLMGVLLPGPVALALALGGARMTAFALVVAGGVVPGVVAGVDAGVFSADSKFVSPRESASEEEEKVSFFLCW